MRKHAARHSNAFGLALFIGSLIGLLVFVALLIKVFLLFHHSSFDNKQQFVLEEQEPEQVRFFVFNPDAHSIKTLMLTGSVPKNPQLALGIPIDATMHSKTDIASISTLANNLLLDRHTLHTSTTIVDGILLFIFIHRTDATQETAASSSNMISQSQQNALFSKIFYDTTIYQEGKSIAIINGTNISGLGNKISDLLSHIGVNVVAVTTADTPSPTSQVAYTGQLSYTAKRVAKLLQIPLIHLPSVGISDITITLGTDKTKYFQ